MNANAMKDLQKAARIAEDHRKMAFDYLQMAKKHFHGAKESDPCLPAYAEQMIIAELTYQYALDLANLTANALREIELDR